MFLGREKELQTLNEKYESNKSELIVIYGRRRVGKSTLIKQFLKDKTEFFLFEGIEGETSLKQMYFFKNKMKESTKDLLLEDLSFSGWENVFMYFTEKIVQRKNINEKLVLFLDEIQWMAAGRKRLISIILC